jgi:RNA-directed DNA polymerase
MVQDASRIRQRMGLLFFGIGWLSFFKFMISYPLFIDFAQINTFDELSRTIGISASFLEEIISAEDQSKFYRRHQIPKRREGEFRTVWEINSTEHLTAQQSFHVKFEIYAGRAVGYPSDEAHGYVSGRSTFTNAQVHAGAGFILHADIKDFFETITIGRVLSLFRDFGMDKEVARALSRFLTVNGILRLGLPASPLIANLICQDLDRRLNDLAGKKGAKYTRYADDMTFSSDKDLPEKIDINEILKSEGFILSDGKYRFTKRGQAHFVTGLSVSEPVPHIPKKIKNGIRRELYYAQKFGLKDHLSKTGAASLQSAVNRIDGTIAYINSVEPELAKKLKDQWQIILDKEGFERAYLSQLEKEPGSLSMFFDESLIEDADGRQIMAVGCATIDDVKTVSDKTLEIYREIMADPYSAADKKTMKKSGLHFVDVSMDDRTKYIEALFHLPFRVFITYDFLSDPAKYNEKYIELLSSLIPQRFTAADRDEVTIVVEQGSASFAQVRKAFEDAYTAMAAKHKKRPSRILEIIEGKKLDHPCISVVDFALAVWGQYAQINKPDPETAGVKQKTLPGKQAQMRFEKLRDKFRLIISRPTGAIFTRKHPFVPWIDGKAA